MVLANGEKVVKSWKWATGSEFEKEEETEAKKNKNEVSMKARYGEVVSRTLIVTNKRLISSSTRKAHGRNTDEVQTTYRDYPVKDIKEIYASHKFEKFSKEIKSTKGPTIACVVFTILAVVSLVLGVVSPEDLLPVGFIGLVVFGLIALSRVSKIKKIKKMNERPDKTETDLWIEFERVYEGNRNTLQFGSKDCKITNRFELKVNADVAKEIIDSIGAVIIAAKEME